jgi:hypothetical protein
MTTILSIPADVDLETGQNPDGYWYALDRNTYDAELMPDGYWYSRSTVGHGKTEQEAIADLLEQMEDEQ